jgi:DNA invertase Pin-like site-specific DNA recombinase
MSSLIHNRLGVGDSTDDEIPPLSALKPLAYGYMQVLGDIPDAEVRRMECELRRFVENKGFCLATIFYEHTSGAHDAFNELTQELHRADAHVVVVPTLGHLARNTVLLNTMLSRLELDAHAEVFELGETV